MKSLEVTCGYNPTEFISQDNKIALIQCMDELLYYYKWTTSKILWRLWSKYGWKQEYIEDILLEEKDLFGLALERKVDPIDPTRSYLEIRRPI